MIRELATVWIMKLRIWPPQSVFEAIRDTDTDAGTISGDDDVS